MEFMETEKRQRKLIRNGYIYVFKKMMANEVSFWECILHRKGNQCNTTIKLFPTDEFIDQVNEYTHASSQTEVEVTKVKSRIKRKATTTLETPQQILGTELRNISEGLRLVYLEFQHYGGISERLAKMSTLRQTLQLERKYPNSSSNIN